MLTLMVAVAGILLVASIFTSIPGNVGVAATWWLRSMRFLAFCKDTKKLKTSPPKLPGLAGERVRVVFIRHGESRWNALFNRFGASWPLRAVKASLDMTRTVLFDKNDSVIIDSPLSKRGEDQATKLAEYVRADGGKKVAQSSDTVVVTSNLRRAMATTLLGVGPRLAVTREKVLIDSALQEGSRNADALSFMTTPGRLCDAPVLSYDSAAALGKVFDPSLNKGNKDPKTANVYRRIDEFAQRMFGASGSLPTPQGGRPSQIIVVGHSLWFRTFFQRFLPADSTHISKKKKMQNCAAVAFDFVVTAGGALEVDEGSIECLHLGFQK